MNQGLFVEDLARVYAAEIVSAVPHLHANAQKIKSDNVLLDSEGYVMLIDFRLATKFNEKNLRSNKYYGTLEFMSVQVNLERSHDRIVD